MPTKDPEKVAAKNRRYREKNRDRLNQERREWAATDEGKRITAERNAVYRARRKTEGGAARTSTKENRHE